MRAASKGFRLPAVRGVFYGWWLSLAGLGIGAMQGLFLGFGFSAFFLPIQSELDVSRAALSAAFSLSQLEAGLTGPLNGWLIDRYGPRRIMIIGFVIFGAGYFLIGQATSLYTFYGAFVFMAVGASMAGFLPVTATITNWFQRRRAIAVGISQSGDGIGGMLVPLLALSIATFGWRATAAAAGPLILVAGIALSSLFSRSPYERGLRPDGDPPLPVTPAPLGPLGALGAPPPKAPAEEISFTPRQALRTPAFWLVAGAHSLTLLMVTGITVHQIPALVSVGLSQTDAALMLSVSTASTVVGRLLFGLLGDKFNRQYALAGCFLLQAIAVLILGWSTNIWMALAFAVLYGFAFGGRGPLLVSIRGDFFGPRSYATIMGMSQTLLMAGTIVGPVFAGQVFDMTGSYQFAFVVMAGINIFAMGVLLAARKPTLTPQPQPAG